MVTTALYTGLSGLRAHQTYIDVIGNNLANVSTAGFRGSRATF
ncbi:MAG: flagellar basal body rod protein FlgG, partial [Planctomycetes bacterium]|nr:flagellar basal body rod protein FlgG [Planctomycetota bacterium]